MSGEYSNATVGSACNYASLAHYNKSKAGAMNVVPPQMNTLNTSGFYIVPAYDAPGYDTLTHGVGGTCSGFLNITDAYGKNADKCSTQYLKKICQ